MSQRTKGDDNGAVQKAAPPYYGVGPVPNRAQDLVEALQAENAQLREKLDIAQGLASSRAGTIDLLSSLVRRLETSGQHLHRLAFGGSPKCGDEANGCLWCRAMAEARAATEGSKS